MNKPRLLPNKNNTVPVVSTGFRQGFQTHAQQRAIINKNLGLDAVIDREGEFLDLTVPADVVEFDDRRASGKPEREW